jgi:hypothetical protein
MSENLQKEFDYFLANQQELARQYSGKILVIKEQTVIGVFDSELEAIQQTSKTHELGTFLVQKCDPTEESHTQTFHSRIAFA